MFNNIQIIVGFMIGSSHKTVYISQTLSHMACCEALKLLKTQYPFLQQSLYIVYILETPK
jgi:hypothetical protein